MSTTDGDPAGEPASDSGVHADEEWKQRVKAEDAAMDASLKAEASTTAKESETANQPTEEAAQDAAAAETAELPPMPPATFEMMVSMFSTQAMVALGVIPNPATGKAEKTPELAKHFIDLLGVLDTKTAGNLDADEVTLLESSLHQLRMAYVQATKV